MTGPGHVIRNAATPGADYFTRRRDPARQAQRLISQVTSLG
ncbi:hypothetical protein [Frankia sp. AvcI1]|nr:hypothetical protein [Frankia sp. AvcI1]